MAITPKQIMIRLYLVAAGLIVFAALVVVKLVNIQMVDGDKYRDLALKRTEKMMTIAPNRGNLYSEDGSLLATSVNRYTVHFDAVTVKSEDFEAHIGALSRELGLLLGNSAGHYEGLLRKARANKNRYALIARNLDYSQYKAILHFPLFSLGSFRGGIIVEHQTVREHPMGKIAERSVGYERIDENGYVTRIGLEGAFGEYLRGVEGKRMKQLISKGQWKPIGLENIVEPKDGYDVISTIDINIQDIAHHALLGQLEKYKAEHGTVIVMETRTGEIKAISNLGRTQEGTYYERLNYAVGESHEPGSTFKLMSLVAALEDGLVDTSTVVDTEKGAWKIYDRTVRDSRYGGYGKISVGDAFVVSSNTAFAKIIHNGYKSNPERFVNRLRKMGLDQPLGLPIIGEGNPVIRSPGDKGWSGISLAWMSHGYEVALTPLQTLAFYNAIANNGEMLRPRLIREVREWDRTVNRFDKEVLNPAICSPQTVAKVKQLMRNVVESKKGTGHSLYSPHLALAGKTGTAQKNYASKDPNKLAYISTFAGYFPADNPEYSCIVIIHEPDKSVGYYGADVSGPVFRSLAQKIIADKPIETELNSFDLNMESLESSYNSYYSLANRSPEVLPDLTGMSGMDAVSILENLGLQVEVKGNGKVRKQSVARGTRISEVKRIVLELS
jgi:cell division protein FtsI (penicillin-binding protein 3)